MIYKLFKFSLSLSVLGLLLTGCTKDFTEINTNQKELTTTAIAENPTLLGQVFAQAEYGTIFSDPFRFQYAQNWSADLYVQYFALTTPDAEADRYDFTDSWSGETWVSFYTDCAPHIKAVEDIALETNNMVGVALAKIIKVYGYSRMTDHYGPIVYSQFGNGESVAPYDSQEDIYKDFFVQLDDAVAILKSNSGTKIFSADDRIYDGEVDKWLVFANSLRLRLAMHIRYADPVKAKVEAEKAIVAGVMTESNEGAFVKFDQINRTPYATITAWGEFRMSAAMESILKGYRDPRISSYFSEAVLGDSDGDGFPFEGLLNGQSQAALTSPPNDDYSDLSLLYMPLEDGGTNGPYTVITAAEVYFLRAEGALQGWEMGGTPKEMYEMGIRTSLRARSNANTAVINDYINSTDTPLPYEPGTVGLTDIPVLFTMDPETQLEQIITQKWIAIYPDGWEAWVDLRRTGYPKMYERLFSDNPDVGTKEIMRRLKYPDLEADTNLEGLEGALALPEMQGGNKNSTKVWWDKRE